MALQRFAARSSRYFPNLSPPPIQMVAKVILGVVVFIFIIVLLLQITGVGGDLGSVQVGHYRGN